MARAKKEAALTPEERLQAALVPDWEWPYKLPENWCWVQLSSLKDGANGFFDGDWILSENMDNEGEVRLLQLSDIGITEFLDKSSKHINYATFEKLGCTELLAGDVMISRMAEPIARSCIVPQFNYKVITAVDVAVLRCNKIIANNRYINYLCNVKWFTDSALSLARGTTRVRITRQNLGEMPVPLPPLAEQQRIVERIESLFAKLDEAKEKAQAVVDSFETRKAAILHKAFTGELTANWREAHDVGMECWSEKRFKEILDVRDGTHDSPQYYEQGYPLVTSKNLKDGIITDKDIKFISKEDYEQINQRSKVDVGDILFAMIGTIGNPVVVTEEPKYAIKNVALMKNIGKADPFFVRYYLETKYVKDKMQTDAKGSTQKFVPLGYLRDFRIKLPNTDEQAEIVRILDDLFAKEQQAMEAAEAVLEKIDLMKKSILARAFRGELGTNDPTDEPAVELLKKVLDIPAESKPKAKRKFIPKELDAQIKTDIERKIIKAYIQNETDVLPIKQLMSVSSKKFDVMEALRNLQNRGILLKENDTYTLMG
ncbi:MAG: restriction endonuclease subunit S [Eubacteriales bacterium]|nr:restriction endonuclease subunit S [Eubacteriales bacterium]